MSDYKKKYLKYKKKYLNIRKIHGGMDPGGDQQWEDHCQQGHPLQWHQGHPPQWHQGHPPQWQQGYLPQWQQGQSHQWQQGHPHQWQQGQSHQWQQKHPHQVHSPIQSKQHMYQQSPKGLSNEEPPKKGRPHAMLIEDAPKKGRPHAMLIEDAPKKELPNEESLHLDRLEKLENQLDSTIEKLELCEKKFEDLKKIAVENSWDITKNKFEIPYLHPSKKQLFPASGPLIFNRRIKEIEDEVTEYKDYENIYSGYQGEGIKDLDYKPDKATTKSPKEILFKNIIAFLNTRGGRLFFGITDNLFIRGIKNINTDDHRDHFMRKITIDVYNEIEAYDIVNKTISPPPPENIVFIWHYIFNSAEPDKKIYVLEIQVNPGSPNYIYKKGSDVWFRHAGLVSWHDLVSAEAIIKQRNEAKEANRYHNCPKLEMKDECEEDEEDEEQ